MNQYGEQEDRGGATTTNRTDSLAPWLRSLRLFNRFDAHSFTQVDLKEYTLLARLVGSDNLSLIRNFLSTVPSDASVKYVQSLLVNLERLGPFSELYSLLSHFNTESEAVIYRLLRGIQESGTDTPEHWRDAYRQHRSPRIALALAKTLARELQYGNAERLLERLLEKVSDKHKPTIWRALADHHFRTGDYEKWSSLLERNRTNIDAASWSDEQLKFLFETGKLKEARALLDTPKLSSQSPAGRQRANARLTLAEGFPAQSKAIWHQLCEYHHSRSDSHSYVVSLFAAGQFSEAVETATRLTDRFPGDARFPLKAAQGYERFGDYEASLHNFSKAAIIDPRNREIHQGIARCLLYLNRSDDFLQLLEEHDQDDLSNLWTHIHKSLFEARNGQGNRSLRKALAPAYQLSRKLSNTWKNRLLQQPALTWHRGKFLKHPDASVARHNSQFASFVTSLQEGRSIALIGNGPSLIGKGLGDTIDRFDSVIRLNDFTLEGHQSDVGSKVDFWYSSANRLAKPDWSAIEAQEAVAIVFQPYGSHFPPIARFSEGRLGRSLPDNRACFLPTHIHQHLSAASNQRPSTGLRFMNILEFVIQRPYSIAGFDFFENDELHYFEKNTGRLQVGEVHALQFEKDLVQLVLSTVGFAKTL